MKETFYKKVGRRYKPVYEYDQTLMDAFPMGSHMIQVYKGGRITRYNVDPTYAPMIAAGRVAEEAMCDAMLKASELQPMKTPITEGQQKAWKKLAKEFGDELATLKRPSTRDCVEAGVKAMMEEAEKLMQNPSVKKAYEHFLLVCELTKERGEQNS